MHLKRGGLCLSCPSNPRPTLARPCSPWRRVLHLCCSPLHPLDPHHYRGRSLQSLCYMLAFFTYSPLVECCDQRYAEGVAAVFLRDQRPLSCLCGAPCRQWLWNVRSGLGRSVILVPMTA